MNIFWHGQSCFQITVSSSKNNQVLIVIDPFDETTGPKVPSLEADILLISHDHHDHNNIKTVKGNPFLISGPGEYEIKGVFIQGIPAWHDDKEGKERGQNTIYTIEAEEMRLCHLGDLGQKELTPEQLEKIGEIDILMIPVGGIPQQNQWWGTISAKEALKVMSQIEPKIIIPMHYRLPERQRRVEMKRQLHRPPKLKIKLEGIDGFLKTMGIKSIEPLNKLSIKKKDLSEEEAKIIVLKP